MMQHMIIFTLTWHNFVVQYQEMLHMFSEQAKNMLFIMHIL
jgi:hypothetical protein